MASTRRVCSVCCQQQAQYACPRCHKVYCSSACYKQHSSTCSEAFYREQATAQLKATRAEPQQTQQMLEVLQRLHQQQLADSSSWGDGDDDSSDSESSSDEEEDGPEGVLDPALKQLVKQLVKRAQQEGPAFSVRPSDLTPEVVAGLEALSLRGQLSHLVPPWQPWWTSEAAAALQLNAAGQRVVQDMEQLHTQVAQQQQQQGRDPQKLVRDSSAGEGAAAGLLPRPSEEPLPSLQELAGKGHRPSPLLPWQLLQLLVAYCAVLRQFNGEPEAEEGWEAAQLLLLLAPPLVQAALAGSSSSSKAPAAAATTAHTPPTAAAAAGSQAEPAAQQREASIPPADSVRLACLQLLEAAAAAGEDAAAVADGQLAEQLAAIAAAVSAGGGGSLQPERRALLQVAEADALQLLQLGRSAVVLALTDARRLLLGAKERVKQAVQDHAGKGQQQQRQRRRLQQLRQGLGLAGQKVWYLMVWCSASAPMVYQLLAHDLGRELQGRQAMAQQPGTGSVTLTGKARQPSVRAQPVVQQPQQPVIVLSSAPTDVVACGGGVPKQQQAAAAATKAASSGLYDLD